MFLLRNLIFGRERGKKLTVNFRLCQNPVKVEPLVLKRKKPETTLTLENSLTKVSNTFLASKKGVLNSVVVSSYFISLYCLLHSTDCPVARGMTMKSFWIHLSSSIFCVLPKLILCDHYKWYSMMSSFACWRSNFVQALSVIYFRNQLSDCFRLLEFAPPPLQPLSFFSELYWFFSYKKWLFLPVTVPLSDCSVTVPPSDCSVTFPPTDCSMTVPASDCPVTVAARDCRDG